MTALRWLARLLGGLLVALAWVSYVVLTGRTWRHQVRRRWVRREVRAVGNWLALVVAAALLWRPVTTGIVLTVAGGALVGTAVTLRRRDRRELTDHGRSPIRVRATVGTPHPLTPGGGE
ncbi:MAG: hypothetical protein ACRDT2_03360 [Natronosporangium sp.]